MFEIGGNTTFARGSINYPVMLLVPTANPGNLCLYIALDGGQSPELAFTNATTPFGRGLSASFSEAAPENRIFGFWAVTAG